MYSLNPERPYLKERYEFLLANDAESEEDSDESDSSSEEDDDDEVDEKQKSVEKRASNDDSEGVREDSKCEDSEDIFESPALKIKEA